MEVELSAHQTDRLTPGRCAAGGQHRFTLVPIAVAESNDKFGLISCAKCGLAAGVENLSTREQIVELVKSVASFLKKLSADLTRPHKQ